MSRRKNPRPYDPTSNGPKPPGVVLSEWLDARGHSGMWLTRRTGWADTYVSGIIRNRIGVGPTAAVKLAGATDTKPSYWLDLQEAYDAHELVERARRAKDEPDPMDAATDTLVAELAEIARTEWTDLERAEGDLAVAIEEAQRLRAFALSVVALDDDITARRRVGLATIIAQARAALDSNTRRSSAP